MCARFDTTGLLADVTYTLLRGRADAGRERCCLYRRAEGGYWLTSEVDLTLPVPRSLYIEAHVAADWRVESLDVRLLGDTQRDATYRLQDDGQGTPLHWQATIQTDETTLDRAISLDAGALVEFDSAWSTALMLDRLKLASGQVHTANVLRIGLPSLEPVSARMRFKCIGAEHVTTFAGEFDAMRYRVSRRDWWLDSRGIVVAADNVRLVEYHWLGSADGYARET